MTDLYIQNDPDDLAQWKAACTSAGIVHHDTTFHVFRVGTEDEAKFTGQPIGRWVLQACLWVPDVFNRGHRWIRSHAVIYDRCYEKERRMFELLRGLWLHELEERWTFDGKRPRDPHAGPDFPVPITPFPGALP